MSSSWHIADWLTVFLRLHDGCPSCRPVLSSWRRARFPPTDFRQARRAIASAVRGKFRSVRFHDPKATRWVRWPCAGVRRRAAMPKRSRSKIVGSRRPKKAHKCQHSGFRSRKAAAMQHRSRRGKSRRGARAALQRQRRGRQPWSPIRGGDERNLSHDRDRECHAQTRKADRGQRATRTRAAAGWSLADDGTCCPRGRVDAGYVHPAQRAARSDRRLDRDICGGAIALQQRQ